MKKIFLTIHIPIAIGLLATGYASCLNPKTCGIVALAGYGLPIFLALTVLSLAIAAFTYKRHLIIPVTALILAYGPVTLYMPYHNTQQVPEEALTVISYNTHSWGLGDGGSPAIGDADGGRTIMRYLADSKADIVCLQESDVTGAVGQHADSILNPAFKYHEAIICSGLTQLAIYSRFPIIRKQAIKYESKGNGSAAFWIDVKGQEIIVINNHLESTGLSIEERHEFSDMVHGKNETIKSTSKSIFGKLLESTRIRVPQAKAIAAFIRAHRHGHNGLPIIVCGDFNDIPQSYVYRTIADGLTDCYKATAKGPGFSFSRHGMRVRIDNYLCTPDITPYNFEVDHSITISDHYPITGRLLLPAK